MKSIQSPLPHIDLHQKRVFLRADLNVPLSNGAIISDLRLKALLPTIQLIHKHGGKIILATHIGRPADHEPALSTQHLIPWFTTRGYHIAFEADLAAAYTKSFGDPKIIVLLENLRFYPGETNHDAAFAQTLARLGDYYVNDAFGSLHRTDCSLLQVPQLFAPHKRMIGLLIENEINHANRLLDPDRPFTCIVGGNKIHDKLLFIQNLLPKIDSLLLCPAICFTYLYAQGKAVGASLIDPQAVQACHNLIQIARDQKINIATPDDFLVSKNHLAGPYTTTDADQLQKNDYGVSIGNKTQALFAQRIEKSKTTFYNGLMGDLKEPASLQPVAAIFEAMSKTNYSVIGGGDSTAAAQLLGFQNKISHLSTGGGSLLAYLSGKPLPALEILLNK